MQRACEELLDMVATWPRENTEFRLGGGECDAFRQHCSQAMYQVGVGLEQYAAAPSSFR